MILSCKHNCGEEPNLLVRDREILASGDMSGGMIVNSYLHSLYTKYLSYCVLMTLQFTCHLVCKIPAKRGDLKYDASVRNIEGIIPAGGRTSSYTENGQFYFYA